MVLVEGAEAEQVGAVTGELDAAAFGQAFDDFSGDAGQEWLSPSRRAFGGGLSSGPMFYS